MKVLHVNAGSENGGGLFHIINLLTEAKKNNQDFELLTLEDGPVAKAARQKGIKVFTFGAKSRYDLAVLKKLTKFINENHYDIVHTHGARANLYLSLIHKKVNAKWLITVHSDPTKDFEERGLIGDIFTKLNLRALRQADGVIAITNNFAKLLIRKVGINVNKVFVIYNGIFFHSIKQIPKKYAHPYFNLINVARTEKVKGQELLIQAVADINDPNMRLHIAGDGSQLNNLKNLAQTLGINNKVIFHGFMNHDELTELYRRMDLSVLTSYSESFPLVLLEAADNLIPILSTDVGDIEKMIPNESYGFVAQIGSVSSIKEQIVNAKSKTQLQLDEMAKKEKDYLVDNFSMKNQLVDILKIYQVALND